MLPSSAGPCRLEPPATKVSCHIVFKHKQRMFARFGPMKITMEALIAALEAAIPCFGRMIDKAVYTRWRCAVPPPPRVS